MAVTCSADVDFLPGKGWPGNGGKDSSCRGFGPSFRSPKWATWFDTRITASAGGGGRIFDLGLRHTAEMVFSLRSFFRINLNFWGLGWYNKPESTSSTISFSSDSTNSTHIQFLVIQSNTLRALHCHRAMELLHNCYTKLRL